MKDIPEVNRTNSYFVDFTITKTSVQFWESRNYHSVASTERMYRFVDEFFVNHSPESLLRIKNTINYFEQEIIPFFHSKILLITGDSSGWDLVYDQLYDGKTIEECLATCPVKVDIYSIDDKRVFDESLQNKGKIREETYPVLLYNFS